MLRDDKALCVDRVQSFRDHADFDNLNAHVTKQSARRWESQIENKTTRKIAYENYSIQHLVIMMTRTETEHSCIWSVKND